MSHKCRQVVAPLRWSARILGLALTGLIVVTVLAHRLHPMDWPVLELSMLLALLAACSGCVLLWRYEGIGGALALSGISAFYLLNYLDSGRFPGGWVFPLFFVAGALALVVRGLNGPPVRCSN